MRALMGMVVKEFHQIGRDTRALSILLFVPTVMLLFLGYVISMDIKHVSVIVLDEDRSEASRTLIASLSRYEHLDVVGGARSAAEMDRAVESGEARVGIHIPRDFGEDLEAGRRTTILAVIDGTNSLVASSTRGFLRSYVYAFNARLAASAAGPKTVEAANRRSAAVAAAIAISRLGSSASTGNPAPASTSPGSAGLSMTAAPSIPAIGMPGMAVPRVRMYYNPEMRSSFFLIPGLVAFILALANTLATALSIVREKERGTMEQLSLSPLGPTTFIVGKTIPYVVISVVSASLILAAGHWLFGLPMRGSPAMLAGATLVFILCTLSLGLLISSATDSQQIAFTLSAFITILPTFLLSGFVFPIRNMPVVIQWITWIVPARYFVRILRGVLLQDAGPAVMLPDLGMLALLTLALLTVAIVRMRRKGLS